MLFMVHVILDLEYLDWSLKDTKIMLLWPHVLYVSDKSGYTGSEI